MAYDGRRGRSPFINSNRFHKPASVDGSLSGLSHYHNNNHSNQQAASIASTHYAPAPTRTRSGTPTRAVSPSLSSSSASSSSLFKFNFGNPGLAAPASFAASSQASMDYEDLQQVGAKENVTVTVRFRPLSLRELQTGDEVAWYADGDTTVRSEYNPATAYAFDQVFGPATTTRGVYDVAAGHVVRGAMEGINGTVFAYGVTSSGKTHTMHGDYKSPGIIPLAVKDVFNIIQETPDREYLLRVSYLEIYNEVINDLLDPAGQNLRIREDSQGTYVEGIKEEVVLSPAHALSLIAAGEEHRHVGSNNFNLLSSRSHTIFTLTVESSPRSSDQYDDDVTLSQLNLIDLAGSESSKTETTGLRRKEGSYINKSLLTLGTVIGKLSEGRASHVPFRDSKLTRLLQSSLSGHGRVSLICTLTPASSNVEETHNTLKFAQRAKRVAVYAATNRIIDEKSLIKKYQKEIMNLKLELEQLRRGISEKPYQIDMSQEDLLTLRQQLEAGQVKLQSRLEEEEQAKAALLGRIQRLTKLILVSTKTNVGPPLPEQQVHRRRYSLGEEEFISWGEKHPMLPSDYSDDSSLAGHGSEQALEGKFDITSGVESIKDDKKGKKWGMLGWLKLRKNETALDANVAATVSSSSVSSATSHLEPALDLKPGKVSLNRKVDDTAPVADTFPESTQAGELFSTAPPRQRLPGGETMADQMDLLREQVKMLAGEVAFLTSSLKRLSEQASNSPDDLHLQAQMERTKAEIQEKKKQIRMLEQRIIQTGQAALAKASPIELSETISKLMGQLNEKEFEWEIKSADNRILQEQLQAKAIDIKRLQEKIVSLEGQCHMQVEELANLRRSNAQSWSISKKNRSSKRPQMLRGGSLNSDGISGYMQHGMADDSSDSESCSSKGSSRNVTFDTSMQNRILVQEAEIENLRQEKIYLEEENGGLRVQSQKLAEEASYAKELASAAAVELKNLAEEVTKLSFENSKLAKDLAKAHEAAFSIQPTKSEGYFTMDEGERGLIKEPFNADEVYDDIDSWKLDPEDIKMELHARKEREACLEAALVDREQAETELRKKLEEAKKRESDLENDLAGMWVLVAKLKKEKLALGEKLGMIHYVSEGETQSNNSSFGSKEESNEVEEAFVNPVKSKQGQQQIIEELQFSLVKEQEKNAELKILLSQLRSEDLDGLQFSVLEELQSLHVEALTKLFQAKARSQDKAYKERVNGLSGNTDQQDDERNNHVCKICFEAPTAAVLLPCRHFCLCKPCAVACAECPLCRTGIADRIITFTS